MVNEIGRIGFERAPSEACGILLPSPKSPRRGVVSQVIEIPNRSPTHENAYEMRAADIEMEIGDWDATKEELDRIAIWHTHPGGNIGPSPGDLKSKLAGVAYLVVTLNKDNSTTPCWF